MNIIIDRVATLLTLADEISLLEAEDLRIFVIKEEWNKLHPVSKMLLLPYKSVGIIQFVDESKIAYNKIFNLTKRFGLGVVPNNYLIVQSCIDFDYVLITEDSTMIRIAESLELTWNLPDLLPIELAQFKSNQITRMKRRLQLEKVKYRPPRY
jgi:hypothetical protein